MDKYAVLERMGIELGVEPVTGSQHGISEDDY